LPLFIYDRPNDHVAGLSWLVKGVHKNLKVAGGYKFLDTQQTVLKN